MPSSAVKTCALDRKSTRLNSSHTIISNAVFCLKKKAKAPKPRSPSSPRRAASKSRGPPRSVVGADSNARAEGDGWKLRPSEGPPHVFFNDGGTPEVCPLPLQHAVPI